MRWLLALLPIALGLPAAAEVCTTPVGTPACLAEASQALAQNSPPGDVRDQALALEAELLFGLGQKAAALDAARGIGAYFYRIRLLARLGQVEEVRADLSPGDRNALAIALGLADAGNLDAARQEYAALPPLSHDWQEEFTQALGMGTALSGDMRGGMDLLAVSGVRDRDAAIIDLIRHQAVRGDAKGALLAIRPLRKVESRGLALRVIALAQIGAGDAVGARATAARIADDSLRAAVLAAAGDFSLAEHLATTLADPVQRARALAMAGHADAALALVATIPADSPSNWMEPFELSPSGGVVDGLAGTGRFDAAMALVLTLPPDLRDQARIQIAEQAVEFGQYALALQIARTFDSPLEAAIVAADLHHAIWLTQPG